MAEFTDVPFPDVGPWKSSRPADLQRFRRVSVCGHLDELMGLQLLENRKQWHSLIAFGSSKEYNGADNCPVYIKAQCLDCAIEAKDKDDTIQMARLKRILGLYQAGTSQGGFDDVLERHKCSRNQCAATKPRPHAFLEKDQAPRCGVQQKAASYPDKGPKIPAIQLWNAPHYTTGRVESEIYWRIIPSSSESEDRPLHNVIPEGMICGEPSALCLQSERRENKNAGDLVGMTAGRPALARTSNSQEKVFRLVVTSSNCTSSSKLVKQENLFDVADAVEMNSYRGFFNRTMGAECHRTADISASFAKESALIEHLIDEYASILDSAFNPDLVDARYERRRPVLAVLKRDMLDSSKHLSTLQAVPALAAACVELHGPIDEDQVPTRLVAW